MKKRLLALLLSAALLSASIPAAFAADSTDGAATRGAVCTTLLQAADDYNPGVLAGDIMQGDPDGNLRESDPVTRAEALVMLGRAFGTLPKPAGDSARKAYPASNFTDVPDWAQTELQNVFNAGIVAGTSATTFSPEENVTMNQLDLFIRRVYALEGTNLKDDFYATVNKSWLDNSTIKPGQSMSGTLYDKMLDTEPMSKLIQSAVQNPADENAERIAALYGNVLNWDARNKAGITPLKPYLDAIDSAKNLDDLIAVEEKLNRELSVSTLLGFTLSADLKDSTRYALGFSAFAPTLTKDVYAADSGVQKDAYITYLSTLLMLGGQSADAAKAGSARFWAMERAIAPAMMNPEEYGNVDKIYNLFTMDELQAQFPHVDLDKVFSWTGLKKGETYVVSDKGLLSAAAAYFDDAHFEDLQTTMRINLLKSYGGSLSHDFIDASNVYQQAAYGVQGEQTDEEIATQIVQSTLSDEVGHLYAKAYFSPEAKADVTKMVKEFVAFYKERIGQLTWMSAATKAKAIEKLDTMGIKVGYPDDGKWNDLLKGVTLKTKENGGSYFDNLVTMSKRNREIMIDWQEQPVNKDLWPMSPQTVNACYSATGNEIVFPAAMLQAPMYDVNASREENLGGIGYVIAHEITHAFDNNGAKFDKNGNATDWWTKEDYAAFQKLCDQAVTFYDGIEAAPGITCNGTLTLSENIADMGAISCIVATAKQEGSSDLTLLFQSAATTWASTATREYTAYASTIDVHAPDKLRGSRVLQTSDDFYTAFDIQPGDGMYLAPESRVKIW